MFSGRKFAAFLFDMDGTVLNSIAAAERVWTEWAERHGLDVASFLPTIHGKRAIETIGALQLPGVDVAAEADALLKAEMDDLEACLTASQTVYDTCRAHGTGMVLALDQLETQPWYPGCFFLAGLDTSWYDVNDENGAVAVSAAGATSPEPVAGALFVRVVRSDELAALSRLRTARTESTLVANG